MTAFVKPMLTSALAVGCLAVAGGAQQPPAAPPPPPPAADGPFTIYTQSAPVAQPSAAAPMVARVGQGGALTVNGYGGFNESRVWTLTGSADDAKAQQLAKKLVVAKSDEEKDKLRGDMKAALEKAFADRQKRHEDQIKQLEDQVKKLKKIVGDRQEAKGEIIADRMKQLEKDAKGLGWQ